MVYYLSLLQKLIPASPPPEKEEASKKIPDDRVDEKGNPLPNGWTKITSRTHGKVFYHNTSTKQTSWEIPTETTLPEVTAEVEEKQQEKKEEVAATPSIVASSPRVAPSGPASWRSAQGQGQVQGQGQQPQRRDREDNDRGDVKRTRLSSPPSGSTNSSNGTGNGNGNGTSNGNRFPSRTEPPRRTLFLTFPWTSSPRSCSSTRIKVNHGITCG